MKGYIYILQCSDNSFYTGSTNNLEVRLAQHQNGEGANYTKKRLPVKLVFSQEYERIDEAFYAEKQVQGWSRKKKQALINGDFDKLPELAQCQNESHSRNATLPFDSAQGAVTDDVATTDINAHSELQKIALTERSRRVRRARHRPKQQGNPMKENWETVDLGSVCDLIGGGTPSKSKKEYYSGYIPWATVRDMRVENLEETELSITKQAVSDSSTKIIPKNNVIIATRVGLGKVCKLKNDTAINQDLKGVIPKTDNIIPDYVFWWFKNISDEIINAGTGLTVQGVKLPFVKELQIPFITVTEQKQIVALLDQAFKAIDQAQLNIEKNIANATDLFQSKLNAIFSQGGEGWEERTLGEACVVERGSSPRPIKSFITDSDEGVNWIKIGDVGENDKYVRTTKQKITKKGAEKSRFVDNGDFILSNSMSFGRAYIMAIQGYIHDGWFVLRIPKEINSDYFWQLLSSPYLKNQFNQLAAGAIVKNISGDLVKKAIVPIPPLEKQIQIYEETDLLTKKIEEIVTKYETKLRNLEELKKSILQKAFKGELTFGC